MIIRLFWLLSVVGLAYGSAVSGSEIEPNKASLIYYPSGSVPLLGHVVAAYGNYVLKPGPTRSLESRLAMASTKGKPCVRFVFKPTGHTLQEVQAVMANIADDADSCDLSHCVMRAEAPLRALGACKIPFPVIVSPFATSCYLTIGHKLGLNGVERIEYYHPSCLVKTALRVAPGLAFEGAFVGLVAISMSLQFWVICNRVCTI